MFGILLYTQQMPKLFHGKTSTPSFSSTKEVQVKKNFVSRRRKTYPAQASYGQHSHITLLKLTGFTAHMPHG